MIRRHATWGLVLGLAGCAQIFGFDHGTLSSGGLPCTTETGLASDQCDSDFLCMYGACGRKCMSDGECPEGSRCLGLQLGAGSPVAACVTDTLTCAGGCVAGTACVDRTCRTLCMKQADCFTDQRCIDGGCVGTDPTRDPGLQSDAGSHPRDASGVDAPASVEAAGPADAPSVDATMPSDSSAPPADGNADAAD